MFDYYINKDIFDKEIVQLLPKYDVLESVIVDTKGCTIIRDCTKILLDNKHRFDYIDNKLVKIKG